MGGVPTLACKSLGSMALRSYRLLKRYWNSAKYRGMCFWEIEWNVPARDVFILPSMVLTQLKQGRSVLLCLGPTTIRSCSHPTVVTDLKHAKPSLTIVESCQRLSLAHFLIHCPLNPGTTFSLIWSGSQFSVVDTAATKGVLFSDPRPRFPPACSPPQYASSISTLPESFLRLFRSCMTCCNLCFTVNAVLTLTPIFRDNSIDEMPCFPAVM